MPRKGPAPKHPVVTDPVYGSPLVTSLINKVLIGGKQPDLNGRLSGGYYYEPTALKGHNKMRVFQEEIFGPVVAVTTFKDEAEAIALRRLTKNPDGAAFLAGKTGTSHEFDITNDGWPVALPRFISRPSDSTMIDLPSLKVHRSTWGFTFLRTTPS